MVVAYVRFVANIDDQHAPRSCVHAMLLPKADDESGWGEIAVTPSTLHGVGVFPSGAQHTVWDNVHSVPVAPTSATSPSHRLRGQAVAPGAW